MTSRKQKAIAALVRAPTQAEAAAQASVGVSTLRRWLREDEEFQTAYRQALSDLLSDAARAAQSSILPAVELLREVTEDTGRDDRLRIQAADRILTHAVKLIEQYDTQERVAAIEKAIEEMEGDR